MYMYILYHGTVSPRMKMQWYKAECRGLVETHLRALGSGLFDS